jgi:hypothetical protein
LKSSVDNLINNSDNNKEDKTSKINPNNESSSIIGEKLADSNKKNIENVLNQLDKEYSSNININKVKNSKSSNASSASSSPANNNTSLVNNNEQNSVNESNGNNNNNDTNNKEDTTTSSSASLNNNNNNNIKNDISDNNNTSDSNNYNNLTFNNNINNTINSRYKQFEKKKRNCSISSNNNNNMENINNTSTQSNTPPINSAISVNTNLQAEPYDFTLRINKLRFIDDSASSTALTSPAESMNHLYLIGLNGSMSSLNRTKNNSKYKQSLLNSSNYPPQIATTTNELESHTTSSSRTISLPPSTNCSISNSASSTPAFNNPRLKQSRLSTNRMAMIKRQANVKSSTDTLNSDLDQINTGANKISNTNNNISSSLTNNNNNNNQKTTTNLTNSPIVKLNKTSSTPGVQHQHELLTDNLASFRSSAQSNQVKLLQQKLQSSSTATTTSTPTSSSPTSNNQPPQYKQVIKNADGADNMEDDEEIKNIIMHNLNEKLKSNNAQRQLINYNRYKHSNKNNKNNQQQQQSSASSIVSTTTEIESSSSEYEHHHHQQQQQQQKLVVNHHSKNYHSDTTTNSVPNECSSDSSNNNSFRLKPSNIIKPCKYCKSTTKIGACAADSSSNCSSSNTSYLNVKTKNNANLIIKQAKLEEKFRKVSSKKLISSTTSTNSSINEASHSVKNINNNNNNNNGSILSSYHYYHGYSPVKYQERVYAYDNFDCINECLEENEQQYIQQLNQKRIIQEENKINDYKINEEEDDEEDEDEKCFTSILVEDGFIRMSSPVGEGAKQLSQSSNIPSGLKNNSNDTKLINAENNCSSSSKPNFPNVGSSPISEQFFNSNSSSDNEETIDINQNDDQYQNLDGIIMHNRKNKRSKNMNTETLSDDEQIIVQLDDENLQEEEDEEIEDEEEDVELNGEEEDEEDDIENLLEQEGEEIEEEEEELSEEEEDDEVEEESSDENEQLIEDGEDQYELEQDMMLENESLNDEILRQYEEAIEQEIEAAKTSSSPKKIKNMQHNQLNRNYYGPTVQNKSMQKSIMKNRHDQPLYQTPIYASLENSENITNHSLATISSQVSSSYNYSSIDNTSNNLINKMASMTFESSSSSQVTTTTTTTTTSHTKPKVRFNLDINYEKEREWNRVNKIIGDASKSQIEWTQEVEV